MSSNLNYINELIHRLTAVKASYILLINGLTPEVLAEYGNIDTSLLEQFNHDIALTPQIHFSALENWSSFKNLNKEAGIKSAYIKKIFADKESNALYYLVLLSDNQDYFNGEKIDTIEPLEAYLYKFLVSEQTSSDKINPDTVAAHLISNIINQGSPVFYSADRTFEKYFFISDSIKSIFGYTAEEVYNNAGLINGTILDEDLYLFHGFRERLADLGSAETEFRIKDKLGNIRYIRNSGILAIENNEPVRIDGIIIDITKERQTQAELEKSEERFRLLIETANDLIFNLDSYGYYVMVNNYGALALGYKPEEMISRHFLEFIGDDYKTEIAIAFQQILKSDKVISFDAGFVDKYGKSLIFEIQCRPTIISGRITGMLGIARDITQRFQDEEKLKELNSRLIEANRLISIERDRAKQQVSVLEEVNKLKNEFISNISHELRTPLASIIGFSETILGDKDMPHDMIYEFNNIILSEGKRLAKLINDVLDFAKMEAGNVEIFKDDFDIVELLKEVINTTSQSAQEKGITLTCDIPLAPVRVLADRERIFQVYQHLIINAIKFTERGGRITVIAQDFMKEFEVIVSDTGIGIPARDIPNVFQKFFKVSPPGSYMPGTGIGLGLVKQIVDLHKGLISVQSELNKGTTFIVKIPKKAQF